MSSSDGTVSPPTPPEPRNQPAGNSPIQREAGSVVALFVLIFMLGGVLWLTLLALRGDFGDLDGDRPQLNNSWHFFVWLLANGTWISKTIGALVGAIGICAQFLSALHKNLWTIVGICVACLIGMATSFLLLSLIGTDVDEPFRALRSFTNLDNAGMSTALQAVLGGIAGWFVSFMIVQLGISSLKAEGALKSLLKTGD